LQRSDCLDRLKSAAGFDLVIVGGGATGLGSAVDAVARGLRVALIEQSDFAKGASSRSTKLVHGGVRYLKRGNVLRVREALRERGRLAHNAPHLVRNLEFVIPSYTWWEGPFYGIGLKAYDALAGSLGLGRSRRLSREETVAAIPTIETAGLKGGVRYHDGQFDDARLAINLAATAWEMGAVLLNYCACTGFIKKQGRVAGVLARDVETGEAFEIRARAVVNATGVFVDAVRRMDRPESADLVTISQGIHLVLPRKFLPGNAALMVPKTTDGRVLFALPWQGHVVVGTTDTPVLSPELEPRAQAAEREFVLQHARRYLAQDPSDSDVLSVFAGLRPLVKTWGAKSTAALSREHAIITSASGLISVTGGKWTTYRKMAEDVVDQAEKTGGLKHRPARTKDLPIHGWTRAMAGETRLQSYGADANAVRMLIASSPALTEQLHPLLPFQSGEVIWHARNEMARTVEDVLARRTRALFLNARAAIAMAPAVARLLALELNRDDAWQKDQVESFTTMARGYVFADPLSTRPGR
jgi:glycerol-3-phosphate dehydrogenase